LPTTFLKITKARAAWTKVLDANHQVRSAENWRLQVSDAYASHPCDKNCKRWMPEPTVIEKCLNDMDSFFHVCEKVDDAWANQLAALAFMFLRQNFSLPLRCLVLAAQQHHGQHGCHLPWCLGKIEFV